jgi:hypothetical protein
MNWTIGRRIAAGFGAITCVAAALGILACTQLVVINSHATRITTDSLPGIYVSGQLAEKIQYLGNQNGTLALKHLLSPNDDMKAKSKIQSSRVNAA